MSIFALVVELQRHGVKFIAKSRTHLSVVQPPDLHVPDAVKEEVRQNKDLILQWLHDGRLSAGVVNGRAVEQQELFQTRRTLPPIPPPSEDADYHTQRCNAVLEQWRRKAWGPCARCGQTAWYVHMGFSLCGVCTPLNNYARSVQ